MVESASTSNATASAVPLSAARMLCQAAAWLFVIGLVTGGFTAWAMTFAAANAGVGGLVHRALEEKTFFDTISSATAASS